MDVWLVEQDFNLKDIHMQTEEVQNVKWASLGEIDKMIAEKKLYTVDFAGT